ncbi:hypothetical protein COCNU_scaffold005823G000020 [Cocos nucifera]|nr:hypothetical protein [Cocos nucifera]
MGLARKYGFGKMLVIGAEPPFQVKGLWLFHGQEIPQFVLDECYDMELYDWTKVDISNEAQMERVNAMIDDQEPLRVKLFSTSWTIESMQIWCGKLYLLSGTDEGTMEVLVKQSSSYAVNWLSAVSSKGISGIEEKDTGILMTVKDVIVYSVFKDKNCLTVMNRENIDGFLSRKERKKEKKRKRNYWSDSHVLALDNLGCAILQPNMA